MPQIKPFISIIVPVYKVEKYLPTCIDSILAQTYDNFELILVDDGSPDNCGKICDDYAQNDSRIKLIHQKNQGVVIARNKAIEITKGEYLTFVDSDDFLEKTFLSETIQKAQETNADMVWTDFFENSIWIKSLPDNISLTDQNQVLSYFLTDNIKGFLWNKLIRRNFYQQCNIKTDEKCTMMEDKYIMLQLLSNNPRMAYIQNPLYHYNVRANSATNTETHPFIKALPNIKHMYDYLKNNHILWHKQRRNFFTFVMRVKFTILSELGIEEARNFISFAHKSITYYPLPLKTSLFYWICFNIQLLGDWLYSFRKNINSSNK